MQYFERNADIWTRCIQQPFQTRTQRRVSKRSLTCAKAPSCGAGWSFWRDDSAEILRRVNRRAVEIDGEVQMRLLAGFEKRRVTDRTDHIAGCNAVARADDR